MLPILGSFLNKSSGHILENTYFTCSGFDKGCHWLCLGSNSLLKDSDNV